MPLCQVLPFASPGPRARSSLGTCRPAKGLALLQGNLPPDSTESSADSPGSRLSQGKALAPGEPERGGGGKEVEKVEAESELGRRRGARRGGVERGVPAAIGQ